jgi:glyoxylase-like metal-dependent hydrolase (beta-lactamase superfamily II)
MQQIERGIFYENSYLGVTLGALVLPQGLVMLDAPLRSEDARSWRSALLNQRGGSNRLLVSLDAHPDRTLGTRALECPIIAHQRAAQVFRNRPTIFKGHSNESGADWEVYDDAIGMRWAAPDITFTEAMSIHWGGSEVVLESHPGPTPGSIWVIIPEMRIVFVGDLVTLNQPPFLAYADLSAWSESLGILLQKHKDFVIVSGRGGIATIEDVRMQQKIIKDTLSGLERLSKKKIAGPEIDKFVQKLLTRYEVEPDLQERYAQRLRFGLQQSFLRRFRPSSVIGQPEVESDEP